MSPCLSPLLLSCESYSVFHWRKKEPGRKNGGWVKHSQVSKCTPWHWISDLKPWHHSLACSNEKFLIGASLTLVGMPLFSVTSTSQAQEPQFFPDRSGQVFHLCLPRDVNTTGCNLSDRNTGQIPPAAAHISSSTLSWALKHSLCCSFHGRSSMGGRGMQCWQHCSYKRLLLVFLVISRTALPLEVF